MKGFVDKRVWLALALALVAFIALVAQEPARPSLMTVRDLLALEAPPPDHRLAYGEEALQFGHLRLPEGRGPYPVVLLVHGGCWLERYDITHLGALEEAISGQGFAVWSVEYRRVGNEGGGWPGTFLDVAAAADHLRALAEPYELDLSHVLAVGHSAGGQLALWLAARPKLHESSPLFSEDPLPIAAVLGLAPAPDLARLYQEGVCGRVIEGLMGGSPEDLPERYGQGSPMQLVPIGVPQVILTGGRDRRWGPSGHAYAKVAQEAGDEVELLEIEAAGHFEPVAPGSVAWPAVVAALEKLAERR